MNHPIFKRIFWPALAAILLGVLINEGTFLFLREKARPPQVVELTIPAGTAAEISAGRTPLDLPSTLSFVVGDTILVHNQDEVDHQLGPLWIPAGSSASLKLDQAQKYAFACSFTPTSYLGIDVEQPLTGWTRLGGLAFTILPLMALFIIYSFVLWPIQKEQDAAA